MLDSLHEPEDHAVLITMDGEATIHTTVRPDADMGPLVNRAYEKGELIRIVRFVTRREALIIAGELEGAWMEGLEKHVVMNRVDRVIEDASETIREHQRREILRCLYPEDAEALQLV